MAKKTEQVEITIRAPFVTGYRYHVIIEPADDKPEQNVTGCPAPPHQPMPEFEVVTDEIGFRR